MSEREQRGEALRRLRQLAGLQQQEVAALLGITPGALSQWESGRTELRVTDVQKLAQAFEMPLATLLSELGFSVGEPLTVGTWYDRRNARYNRAHDTHENTAPEGGIAVPQPHSNGHRTEVYRQLAGARR